MADQSSSGQGKQVTFEDTHSSASDEDSNQVEVRNNTLFRGLFGVSLHRRGFSAKSRLLRGSKGRLRSCESISSQELAGHVRSNPPACPKAAGEQDRMPRASILREPAESTPPASARWPSRPQTSRPFISSGRYRWLAARRA